jgi:hypothetical protein
MWTGIVPTSLTPCGLAINDRPHGWSPRQRRGRVRGVARGDAHDASCAPLHRRAGSPEEEPARGTFCRWEFRNLSIGADDRDCPEGELASGERSLVLRRAGQMTLGRS